MLTRRIVPDARLRAYRRDLKAIARRLQRLLRPLHAVDLRASAALRRDGERRAWTEEAEAIWRSAGRNRRTGAHHLAVLFHARAYELEVTESPDAARYWREALDCWAEVHRDDTFWSELELTLPERMGVAVDPAIVAEARRRLPADLLQVHVDLVLTYQHLAPERAREHLRILRSAQFDPAHTEGNPVDRYRTQLLQPTVDKVLADLEASQWQEAIDRLRSWVDESDLWLARWLLHAYRRWNESLRLDEQADRGQLTLNVREAKLAVGRMEEPNATQRPGQLTEELARHHFWRALLATLESQERLAALRDGTLDAEHGSAIRAEACSLVTEAAEGFELARRLDSGLVTDPVYAGVERRQAIARLTSASCRLQALQDGGADERGRKLELRAILGLLRETGRFECSLLRDNSVLVTETERLAVRWRVKVGDEVAELREMIRECR
jgi:hypothetical protein